MLHFLTNNWYYVLAALEAVFRVIPTKKPISPVGIVLNAARAVSNQLDNSPTPEK